MLESTLWLSGYGIGLVPVQPGFNSQPGMENFSAMLYTSHSLNVVRMLLLWNKFQLCMVGKFSYFVCIFFFLKNFFSKILLGVLYQSVKYTAENIWKKSACVLSAL